MNNNKDFNDTTEAIHPTATIEEMNNGVDNANQASHTNKNGSLWMKKPENTAATSNNNKDASDYESSSDGGNHHPSLHVTSGLSRPVADRNAFIQSRSSRHWQTTMTPAERAKRLAEEMNLSLNERRRNSGGNT